MTSKHDRSKHPAKMEQRQAVKNVLKIRRREGNRTLKKNAKMTS